MPRNHISATLLLLDLVLAVAPAALCQSVTAVAKLDLNRLSGVYFELARFPIKREKRCRSDEMVLYALGDKKNTFQIVTSCQMGDDNSDYWNRHGKQNSARDGRLRLAWLWPFTTKYWVLAMAPDYSWAIVGTPNHRSLWLLSHDPSVPEDRLADLKSQASKQGFNISKLIAIPQHNTVQRTSGLTKAPENPPPPSEAPSSSSPHP